MITYIQKDAQTWLVKLAGKSVGQIVESRKGFRYYPKGYAIAGDFFPTLEECKKSLEEA